MKIKVFCSFVLIKITIVKNVTMCNEIWDPQFLKMCVLVPWFLAFFSYFPLVWFVWTPSRGRKVGVPKGILPHVQGRLNPLLPDNWSSKLTGIREGPYGQLNPNTR